MTWAGLRPVAESGVLRWARRALARASVSSVPAGPRLSLNIRLADLTATSARLLDLGDPLLDSPALTEVSESSGGKYSNTIT